MSHAAVNWALDRRGLKPAAKIVLLRLCDRYNPDHGCFPTQAALAHDCEMSRATLNRHLDDLESMGLILREQRVNSVTKTQMSTRYRLAFEPDFPHEDGAEGGKKPCPDLRHGQSGKANENNEKPCPDLRHGPAGEPCLKNDESRVSFCDTNLVREPVNITPKPPFDETDGPQDEPQVEPVTGSEPDGTGKPASAFDQAFARWPGNETDDRDRALKAWNGLEPTDRSNASQHIDRHIADWAAQKRGRRHWTFAKYLTERPWRRAKPDRTIAGGILQAWSAEWLLCRLDLLLAGPGTLDWRHPDHWRALRRFDRVSETSRGIIRPKGWQRPAIETVPVMVGSAEFAAWKAAFERLHWPWRDPPPLLQVLHLPACGPPNPDDMDEFVARFRRRGGEADDEIEAAAE